MKRRRYAIIGTGAVGGYYGGSLARIGYEVHFLFRTAAEARHVRTRGLAVESKFGDFHLDRVNAYSDPRSMPACDVALVALKTTNNHLLPELLPPVLKDGGVVAMFQNGLACEPQAAAVVGERRVLGGLCFVCSHKLGPGHFQHQDYGLVTIGQYRADGQPAGITPEVQQVVDDFEPTKIPFEPVPDLTLARWKKLVWNVPFSGLCVLENTTTDVLVNTPDQLGHVVALMQEVQVGCFAVTGRRISEAHVQKMLDSTRKMRPYDPSMKLDHDAGRPMEVQALFGEPLRQAESAGCPMPRTRAVYERLLALC